MNKTKTVRIALIQARASGDSFENCERAIMAVHQAARRGAKIVCLQELFSHRYFCQKEDKKFRLLAETIPGFTTKIFAKVAAKYGVGLIVPMFEKCGKHFYNSAVVLDAKGRLLGKYRKLHIPYDPLFYEKAYFSPGDLGVRIFSLGGVRCAVFICYDQWFPEAARTAALQGAQILFYPTAIGWQPSCAKQAAGYRDAWRTIQRSHAIANGVFVACVNRVGLEDKLRFWGSSFVCGPFGENLVQASTGREEVIVVDCDLTQIKKTRTGWPFFRDRRPDVYFKTCSKAKKLS